MKKKIVTILILCFVVLCSIPLFIACDKNYTKEETDTLIAKVQTAIDENKAELDEKISTIENNYKEKDEALLLEVENIEKEISALKSKYGQKVEELEKANTDNSKAIADLTTEYNTKVEELEKVDANNSKAIADLTAEYNAKVEELNENLASANNDIKNNKKALENAIEEIKSSHNIKISELEDILESIKNKNKEWQSKIAEIEEKIDKLLSVETFVVTFDSNGGSYVPSQTIENVGKIIKPEDPTRDGYIFTGWYIQGEKWSFIGYVVTEDITLIANWVKDDIVTIEFDGNLATSGSMDNITVKIGETIKLPLNSFAKDGYVFLGWSIERNGNIGYMNGRNYTASEKEIQILYACWESANTDIEQPIGFESIDVLDDNGNDTAINLEYRDILGDQTMENIGTYEGKDNVYEFTMGSTSGAEWSERLAFNQGGTSYLAGQLATESMVINYKTLRFNLMFEEGTQIYISRSPGTKWLFETDKEQTGYVKIFNQAGDEVISDYQSGQWYTVVVDCSTDVNLENPNHNFIYLTLKSGGGTIYLQNVILSLDEFN